MTLAQRELKRHLTYDPSTGVFTRGGKVAGTNVKGYKVIRVNYQRYYAHRLAWLYMNGQFPEQEIDHINGDKSDNRIENLRQCSREENLRNKSIQCNNSIGFKGVSKTSSGNKWRARLFKNKKEIFLGNHDTPEKAHEAYLKGCTRYFGEFAPTHRHRLQA